MSKTIFYLGRKNSPKIHNNGYKKIFHWDEDKYRLDRCVAELLCRTYMEQKKFEVITKLIKISPAHLEDKLNTYDPDHIHNNFNEILEDMKKYMKEKDVDQVTIEIEEARAISTTEQNEIENDPQKRKEFTKRLFYILVQIHQAGIIHRDIKFDNLVFVTRNGKEELVLNDWDAGFLLQGDLPGGLRNVLPIGTMNYIAPEQLNSGKLAQHTDIWQAGMVVYRLYNNLQFPEQYAPIDFELGTDKKVIIGLQAAWESISIGNHTFTPPPNADRDMQRLILWMLSLNSDRRPSAKDILEILNNTNSPQLRTLPPPNPATDYNRIIQMRLRERKNEILRRRAAAAITVAVVAALAIIPKLSDGNGNGSNSNPPNPSETIITSAETTQIISETTETIQEVIITSPETTPEIVTTLTETPPTVITTTTTSTVVSDSTVLGEKSYEYVRWVENCRLGNGYYTGGFDQDNQVHGRDCIYIEDNGNEYYGDFYHGKRDGKGKQITADGVYEGDWLDNAMDGEGTYTYSNGNIYTGELKNNMRNGSGVLKLVVSQNGYQGVYNGIFVNDKFEGIGTFKFDNGDTFSGEFKEDTLWNGTAQYDNGLIKTIKNGKPID